MGGAKSAAARALARVRRRVRRAGPLLVALGRLGYAVEGLVFILVGALAARVALGRAGEAADTRGVLPPIAAVPFGRALLIAIAVGFAGYALWRFVEAAVGPPDEDNPRKAAFKRVGYAARGALYTFFAGSAIKLIIWSKEAAVDENAEVDWTARVLDWPAGTWLVQATGLVIVGAGLYIGWRGLSGKFRKRLKSLEMGRAERRWARGVGTVGMVARMLVTLVIGVFLVAAARLHDPGQAVGIDGALKRLAERSFGPALLVLVESGLAAYGLYSFVEARYRRVGGH